MGLPDRLALDEDKVRIVRDMKPADAYGFFECRDDMQRVRFFSAALAGMPQSYITSAKGS